MIAPSTGDRHATIVWRRFCLLSHPRCGPSHSARRSMKQWKLIAYKKATHANTYGVFACECTHVTFMRHCISTNPPHPFRRGALGSTRGSSIGITREFADGFVYLRMPGVRVFVFVCACVLNIKESMARSAWRCARDRFCGNILLAVCVRASARASDIFEYLFTHSHGCWVLHSQWNAFTMCCTMPSYVGLSLYLYNTTVFVRKYLVDHENCENHLPIFVVLCFIMWCCVVMWCSDLCIWNSIHGFRTFCYAVKNITSCFPDVELLHYLHSHSISNVTWPYFGFCKLIELRITGTQTRWTRFGTFQWCATFLYYQTYI